MLRGRRTIDLFEPEPVGTEVLRDAIEVARWAPNHRLTEPWRFYLMGPVTRAAIIDLAVELDTAAKGERAGAARRARLRRSPDFSRSRADIARIPWSTERITLPAVVPRRI